jgi:hypothetical protein
MSNRLSRDSEDAARVLSALRDEYHPHEALPEKLSATEHLRAKLVNVASGIRKWTIKSAGDDTMVSLQDAGTVHVRTDTRTGQIELSLDGKTFQPALLEYDPVIREWVGSELDPEIVLPAGERRPHKAALVALAEQLVSLLGKPALRS